MKVNLLPPEIRARRRRRLLVWSMALMLLCALGLCGGLMWAQYVELEDARTTLGGLELEYSRFAQVLSLEREVRRVEEALQIKAHFITENTPREPVSVVLEYMSGSTPVSLRLETLNVNGQALFISGYAPDLKAVAHFLVNLRRGDHFLDLVLVFPDDFDLGSDLDRVYFEIEGLWKAGVQ